MLSPVVTVRGQPHTLEPAGCSVHTGCVTADESLSLSVPLSPLRGMFWL